MTVPTEFDFAVLKIGDGGGTEVFSISCGKNDIDMQFDVSTDERKVRDCAKPGEVPFRKIKATGKMADITATGLTDKAAFGTELALLGKHANIKVELLADDGTDAGSLLGTVAMNALVASLKIGAPRENASSATLSLKSHGAWTWTAV